MSELLDRARVTQERSPLAAQGSPDPGCKGGAQAAGTPLTSPAPVDSRVSLLMVYFSGLLGSHVASSLHLAQGSSPFSFRCWQ